MAADNTSEVHPQSIQRAGILGRVQLVGNLATCSYIEDTIMCVGVSERIRLQENRKKCNGDLFVVRADEVEDKAPVHERQQVTQEESQTVI